MTLVDKLKMETSKLTTKKIQIIKNVISHKPVAIVRPKRPDGKGSNSEVVIEMRLKEQRKKLVDKAVQKNDPSAKPAANRKCP